MKLKKIKIALSLGYPNSYSYTNKIKNIDLMAIFIIFFDYIMLLLFVNANVMIYHV